MHRSRIIVSLVLSAALVGVALAEPVVKVPTEAELKARELGPVEPAKDPKTGFVVGGVNSTETIRALTGLAGRPIADLERDMRPGAAGEGGSESGFLGPEERLLDVLASDNDFVLNELKTTHQEIARHLKTLAAISPGSEAVEVDYEGRRFRVSTMFWRGYQHSPFQDGTKTNVDVTVTNVETGRKLEYSLLVPLMIERYGFYEGKGTSYRVDPQEVVLVLDFLRPSVAKE